MPREKLETLSMESARLQREQTKSEPVGRDAQKVRAPVTNVSRWPLILNDAHSPALHLGHAFGPSHTPLPPALQAKLMVNEAGDQYEQEADRVADRVMRMPDTAARLQRKCDCGGQSDEACEQCASRHPIVQRWSMPGNASTAASAPSVVHDVLRLPGEPLDTSTRAFMESRFGYDLNGVRLHTDAHAAHSARAVGAAAYTVGHHVVFGSGEYAPQSQAGQRLIAHELTHVVQQSNKPDNVVHRQTRRQIRRDDQLRRMAARPSLALEQWRRLPEGERMVVVTYMTMFYSLDFARHFAATAARRHRPETIIHVTNVPDMTPERLTRGGFRLAFTFSNLSRMEIWVHPSGNEVWRISSLGSSAQQESGGEQTPPPAQPPPVAENPPHIDLPANPVAVYGAVSASRQDAVVLGGRGRAVRYADGTVEFYPAGSSARYTYRPQPGGENAYDFYDENGDRTIVIALDFNEVFGSQSP